MCRCVLPYTHARRGVNLVGNLGGGDDDRLLLGPNFLLAKLFVLKHLTQYKTRIKMFI